jgi:antitoxin component YwqK of YwqJK toxin-antitoxin module
LSIKTWNGSCNEIKHNKQLKYKLNTNKIKPMKKTVLPLALIFFSISFLFAQDGNKFDKNRKRHGSWIKRYQNGMIRYKGEFNHGKEINVFKYYTASNNDFPVLIKRFNNSDDTAYLKYYTERGVLLSEGKMELKNKIGKWIYYHKDGKTIMHEENYVNNILEGEFKTYFDNKKPTIIANYKNGKLHGNYKRFAIKGHVYQDINYIDGKLNGLATYYNRKTGVIESKGHFSNDLKVGLWDTYLDGELISSEEVKYKLKK